MAGDTNKKKLVGRHKRVEETITKYLSNGMTANLFNARGYDYSVFEQIPPGLISVNWSGEFGVDLYIFLKRKEAAW